MPSRTGNKPGAGHSTATVLAAKRLVHHGYSAYAVAKHLNVDRCTVKRWTDPQFAERARKASARSNTRKYHSGHAKVIVKRVSNEGKWQRIKDLRKLGLSYRHVAGLMNFDFDLNLTDEQVRYALAVDIPPEPLR